ncbi:MAG TPA: cysteine hydrolase family protein [Streptosporangiaceae bacterium]|nr:cysteine hydrolase family protein [Streptosporangiaceae bacterium]
MHAVQALLLIDIQAAFVSGTTPVPRAEPLLSSATNLLTTARRAGSLVVHVQNDGAPGAVDEPGQPGWQLYLPAQPGEPVVRKSHDDAFDGTGLGAILVAHRVGRLAIAGVMSEMCVAATARTALDRGYHVVLPHDAHATYDVPAGPGFAQLVPAEVVARVAEWSLGDQIELTSSSDEVSFEHV